jgi:chemotaxis response regulator CheB
MSSGFEIIAMAASAGGLEALTHVLGALQRGAVRTGVADFVLPLEEIAPALQMLVGGAAAP